MNSRGAFNTHSGVYVTRMRIEVIKNDLPSFLPPYVRFIYKAPFKNNLFTVISTVSKKKKSRKIQVSQFHYMGNSFELKVAQTHHILMRVAT